MGQMIKPDTKERKMEEHYDTSLKVLTGHLPSGSGWGAEGGKEGDSPSILYLVRKIWRWTPLLFSRLLAEAPHLATTTFTTAEEGRGTGSIATSHFLTHEASGEYPPQCGQFREQAVFPRGTRPLWKGTLYWTQVQTAGYVLSEKAHSAEHTSK